MKKILVCLVLMVVSSLAFADGACQALELNGTWECQGGKTLKFNVTQVNGAFQMNPTASLDFAVLLDGVQHDDSRNGMELVTTGSCLANVVSLHLTMNEMMDVDQVITIQSAKVLSIAASTDGQSFNLTCKKQ